MTDEFDNFVDSWPDRASLWLNSPWHPSWTVADASYQSLLNKIESSWLKKRMLREGFATDDNSADDNAFTINKKIGGENFSYLRWLHKFDRFIDDWNASSSGSKPSLNCSNEEITVAFYWFIWSKERNLFKSTFLGLLNKKQERNDIRRKNSDLFLQASTNLKKWDIANQVQKLSAKDRCSSNRRLEEAAYLLDSDRAVPLVDMALAIDTTVIHIRNSSSNRIVETGYCIQTMSLLRLAIHPVLRDWSVTQMDGATNQKYYYCKTPGSAYCWIKEGDVKLLEGMAPVFKLSSFERPDNWVDPGSRIYDIASVRNAAWQSNDLRNTHPLATGQEYELSHSLTGNQGHEGIQFDKQTGQLSLPTRSAADCSVTQIGYARKVKPSGTTNPTKEKVSSNYIIRGVVPDRWKVKEGANVREFSSESINSGTNRKTVVKQKYSGTSKVTIKKDTEIELLSHHFEEDLGTYDNGVIIDSGQVIGAYEGATSTTSIDWLKVRVRYGATDITGLVKEVDVVNLKAGLESLAIGVFDHVDLTSDSYWTDAVMTSTVETYQVSVANRACWTWGSWVSKFKDDDSIQVLSNVSGTPISYETEVGTQKKTFVCIRHSKNHSFAGFVPLNKINVTGTEGVIDDVIQGICGVGQLDSLFPNGVSISVNTTGYSDSQGSTFISTAVKTARTQNSISSVGNCLVLGISNPLHCWLELPRLLKRLYALGIRVGDIAVHGHGERGGVIMGVRGGSWDCGYSTLTHIGESTEVQLGKYPTYIEKREWDLFPKSDSNRWNKNSMHSMFGRRGNDASLFLDSLSRAGASDITISFLCCNTARRTVNHTSCVNCDNSSPHGFAHWFWYHLNDSLPDISVVGHKWGGHLLRCVGKIRIHRNNGLYDYDSEEGTRIVRYVDEIFRSLAGESNLKIFKINDKYEVDIASNGVYSFSMAYRMLCSSQHGRTVWGNKATSHNNWVTLLDAIVDDKNDVSGHSKEDKAALFTVAWGCQDGLKSSGEHTCNFPYTNLGKANELRPNYEFMMDGQAPRLFFTDPELMSSFSSLYLHGFRLDKNNPAGRSFAVTLEKCSINQLSTFESVVDSNDDFAGSRLCEVTPLRPIQAKVELIFDSVPTSSNAQIPAGTVFSGVPQIGSDMGHEEAWELKENLTVNALSEEALFILQDGTFDLNGVSNITFSMDNPGSLPNPSSITLIEPLNAHSTRELGGTRRVFVKSIHEDEGNKENKTGWLRHQDLTYFPNRIWRDE